MSVLDSFIDNIIASKPELSGLVTVIEKEIIHHEILRLMCDERAFENLTFIGGTALRLCYDSARLSEDLNFTGGTNFEPKSLIIFSNEIEKQLSSKFGQNVFVKEPKENLSDTATWKISIERQSNRPDIPNQIIHIGICAYDSFDIKRAPLKDHYNIKPDTLGLLIPVQSQKEILADKFIALAYRNRIKPRDLWDITWLTQNNIKPNDKLINQKLDIRGKNQEDFINRLNEVKVKLAFDPITKSEFDSEMARFITPELAKNTLHNDEFYQYMSNTVYGGVDKVIQNIENPQAKTQFYLGN